MPVTATRALYIKLGEGNRWARLALDSGTLRFGFRDVPHERALAAAQADDFRSVKDFYEQRGVVAGTATRYSNEVREFYTAGNDVLWITFAEGRMWWCFAAAEVIANTDVDPDTTGSRRASRRRPHLRLRHHPRRLRNTTDDDEHDDIHDERDNADVEILDGLRKRRDELFESRLGQCHRGDGGNPR